jgi:Zn-dependent M28 family amino/carboxypeptidase
MKPHRAWKSIADGASLGRLAVLVTTVMPLAWQTQVPPAYVHLAEFQVLADEHGDRAAGHPGYEAAARYVEQELGEAGYESHRQYFTVEYRGEDIETFNILAEAEAHDGEAGTQDDDTVIMMGAHLDGVPGSPAINDNASGAAALLEAAKTLSAQVDTTTTVRFAWWGAEEYPRSPGSRHYVEDLAENDSEALEDIAAYVNVDMVASPNPVIGIYDALEADPGLEVPDGSTEVMEVFTDYFESRDQLWIPTGWNFLSDQVVFIENDIAVGGVFTGSDEEKSDQQARLFGGEARRPRDPNYHQPGDDLSNIDLAALDTMTDAITYAATALAGDDSALE